MKRTFLFFPFLSFIFISYAQKDLRKGYIIENSGDTLFGMINFQSDVRNSKECIFYSESGEKKEFLPFDINGYRFEDGKYYVSKYIEDFENENQIFAEYLVQGQKDLLYYRDSRSNHFLLSKNDSVLIEIPYEEKIVTIQGKSYLYESNTHIAFLESYFSDCPSVYDEIEKMKKPEKKNLISISKKYHDDVCGENSCIIYKKKKTPVELTLEPRFEMTKFKGDSVFRKLYGGLIYIWLPETNEKLYLKTGFLYSKDENDVSMYKIPFKFEYVFPYKIIRPKFDLGVNAYFFKNPSYFDGGALTMAASTGFFLRTTNFMHLDFDFESDILLLTNSPTFFASYSICFGVFITF